MTTRVAIVGSGRMGRGICVAYLSKGVDVALIDVKPREAQGHASAREAAQTEIDKALETMRGQGLLDGHGDPGTVGHFTSEHLGEALAGAELVFEAVPEVLEVKRDVLAAMEPWLDDSAVIASTSSSFVSTQLAAMVARPQRLANAHWLNPAYLVPLVEVSPHPGTGEDALQRLMSALRDVGKIPVLCSPAAGYIVPRLQTLLMNEVARMIEEGAATAADIDKATRFGLGIRYAAMGVAEFIDFGGMDILHHASRYLSGELGPRFASPDIVARKLETYQVGARTGTGFYDWSGVDLDAYRGALTRRLVERVGLAVSDGDATGPAALRDGTAPVRPSDAGPAAG